MKLTRCGIERIFFTCIAITWCGIEQSAYQQPSYLDTAYSTAIQTQILTLLGRVQGELQMMQYAPVCEQQYGYEVIGAVYYAYWLVSQSAAQEWTTDEIMYCLQTVNALEHISRTLPDMFDHQPWIACLSKLLADLRLLLEAELSKIQTDIDTDGTSP